MLISRLVNIKTFSGAYNCTPNFLFNNLFIIIYTSTSPGAALRGVDQLV